MKDETVALVRFILDRITEDEKIVHEDEDAPYWRGPGTAHRLLTALGTKRRIVAAVCAQIEHDDEAAWIVASNEVLLALASDWADHDDYRWVEDSQDAHNESVGHLIDAAIERVERAEHG